MTTKKDRRPRCPRRGGPKLIGAVLCLLTAGPAQAQAPKPAGDKPGGDKAAWQKRLDEMANRTQQSQKGFPPAPPAPAQPAPPTPNAATPAPAQAPTPVPVTTPQVMTSTGPEAAAAGQGSLALFEDDFDHTGVLSYAQRRVVLLVFAPQAETDGWRHSNDLQSWGQRAVICPVHEGAQGPRAGRLAKAFGIDPTKGGVLTALVRAPENLKQVTGDQLLYQVLGRYPPPQEAADVARILQEGVAAYDAKKVQYAWDATLTGVNLTPTPPEVASTPPPAAPPPTVATVPGVPTAPAPSAAPPSVATPSTASPPADVPMEQKPKVTIKPPDPVRSAFETAVARAWQKQRPVMFIFPGQEPFDKAKCAEIWSTIPGALAPELLVLTPGSADGSIGGKPVDWEAFFDVGGQYPTAVMAMPEHAGDIANPKVEDMTFRLIARRQGALSPESAEILSRLWMSEDFDAVILRAWVLRRPLVLVFPHPDHERELLDSPALEKMEERAAVFVNSKDAVSGIRRKTAAQIEKDFATANVERSEVVLLKLESKVKDAKSVRLDQIQLTPVNRAFAKKTPEKILEWTTTRVPAKPSRTSATP